MLGGKKLLFVLASIAIFFWLAIGIKVQRNRHAAELSSIRFVLESKQVLRLMRESRIPQSEWPRHKIVVRIVNRNGTASEGATEQFEDPFNINWNREVVVKSPGGLYRGCSVQIIPPAGKPLYWVWIEPGPAILFTQGSSSGMRILRLMRDQKGPMPVVLSRSKIE